ncbi:GrpB family protein [Nocardiopsis sp. HNM0947]|uniref:GrpB family protein n=1 Tax=Nocardiopsis coralli TaxID=2772213 RepID=A0ABR9PEZ0_9ACTN|nr:GrpB family protein [Nocardiopsis coralli]MBE3002414.1 GrpB family protein [Nocardiopsis coralli]
MAPPEPPELPTRGQDRPSPELASKNLVDGRVYLAEPDPKWPYLFEREALRIRQALGERVLLLEHVGSTAVPGLIAKPCVDILLCVDEPADEDAYVPDLEKVGYTLAIRKPDWHDHRVLGGNQVNINLHVFAPECEQVGFLLRLRDHLCEDADARARYTEVKTALAERTWDHILEYVDAKTEVVQELLDQAKERQTA